MPSLDKFKATYPGLELAITSGTLSVFVGAGLSKMCGLPTWAELMAPLASSLGLKGEKDPIIVAQYYQEAHASGRNLLISHIIDAIDRPHADLNLAHRYLKSLPLNYILTTNYDQLIEHAFRSAPHRDLNVVVADGDTAFHKKDSATTLYKLNGCLTRKDSIVISQEDFDNYQSIRPQMCDNVRSILSSQTVLYIGTSFQDPVFKHFRNEVLKRIGVSRAPPSYIVMLRSNKFEIESFRRRGVDIINLDLPASATQDDITSSVTKVLELLTMMAEEALASRRHGDLPKGFVDAVQDIITRRLGTGLSAQRVDSYADSSNRIDHLWRQDLLDYSTGNFYSIRKIDCTNVGYNLSTYITYTESSEKKLSFKETGIVAYSVDTRQPLRVESDRPADEELYRHTFRIFFEHPLAPQESASIVFSISLPGELTRLSASDEVMSVSLIHFDRGVMKLTFDVCLNFEPAGYQVDCLDQVGVRTNCGIASLTKEQYFPRDWFEADLGILWSAPPWRIRFVVDAPSNPLYIINYKARRGE